MIKEGEYSLHPQCSNPSITHICFADDLFLLCTPNEASFQIIHKALQEFHKYSGLMPNGSKSKVYIAGLEDHEKQRLCSILGFQLGSLPVKYLGVPLITTKLKYGDCKELIEKVTAKVKSWTSRCLSYAGRLVLVKFVLYSIQVFWSIHFILPKGVTNAIEQILRRYLWTGAELRKWGSKVAWKEVCRPKIEGGLGIRSLQEWNKASMLRHIWAICSDKPSLWVTWCKNNLLKGKCFWMIKSPSDCSWTWRKLLKLREVAINLSKYVVGDGSSISLWYSNWHPNGALIPRYGERIAYDAGLCKDSRVSNVILNNQWKWPYSNTWELKEIVGNLPSTLPNASCKDTFIWMGSKDNAYSSLSTWESIRLKVPKVKWHTLLWFPSHIPKHSFILWLAIRAKLNTKDKLGSWGMNVDPLCVLCGSCEEDLDHLFFRCPFSAEARKATLHTCSPTRAMQGWNDEVSWAIGKFSKKSIGNTIGKLAWSALVYYIWQERNNRIFKGLHSSTSAMVHSIKKDIKAKLSQVSLVKNDDVIRTCNLWGISL